MEQDDLRNKLIYALEEIGLKAKAVSEKTGLSQSDLSRFKTGKILLCYSDAQKLNSFLESFNLIFYL